MRTKSEVCSFVLSLMKEHGITKSQLGEILGANGASQLKVQKANQFLNPDNPKINLSELATVADVLNLHPREILMRPVEKNNVDTQAKTVKIEKKHLVPLIGIKDVIPFEEDTTEEVDWVVFPFESNSNKYVATRLLDNHLAPLIKENSVVFIDTRTYLYSLQEKIVLVRHNKQRIIRQLLRNEDAGEVELRSISNKDESIFVGEEDDFEVIGVITHVIQPLGDV